MTPSGSSSQKRMSIGPGTSIGKRYQQVFLLCLLLVLSSTLWTGLRIVQSRQTMDHMIALSDSVVVASEANAVFQSKFTLLQSYVAHPTVQTLEEYNKKDASYHEILATLEDNIKNQEIGLETVLEPLISKEREVDQIFMSRIIPELGQNDRASAELLLLHAIRIRAEFDLSYQEYKSQVGITQQQYLQDASESYNRVFKVLSFSFLMSFAIAFAFFLRFNHKVEEDLSAIIAFSSAVAQGNTDGEDLGIQSNEEFQHFSDALNNIKNNYRLILGKLNDEIQSNTFLIKDLATKNTELERFTYTVSHDLKSPLITIKGFIGMILADMADGSTENLANDLAKIEKSADHMQMLLQDLLELSRIGRVTNPPTTFSLEKVLEEVLDMLEAHIREKNAVLTVDSGMPDVYADRFRIMEVYQNLIENALKYADPKRPVEIHIGLSNKEEGDRVFFVADNGVGIEPEYRDKVFNLFEKLDSRSEGTGIGLAIVKRIIELHEGTIWIESGDHNVGAKFCFTLKSTY